MLTKIATMGGDPSQPRARDRNAATLAVLALAFATLIVTPAVTFAQSSLIKDRHAGTSRGGAASNPRTEGDQALVDGWPLYRTERGQAAFNDVMAALKVTDGPAPHPAVFKGCANLDCNISLPPMSADGWLPAGRIWISPTEYLLVAHSPRERNARSYRRRMLTDMKVFVFHEFLNSSRNTDVYDTISAHKGSVFVPLYMSKEATDARGHRFVTVVQVAPYNVRSIHATNWGSNGPGMEVAKNSTEPLEPLQAQSGILIASMIKTAAPQLRVVNHHGNEGLPMLNAYNERLAALRNRAGAPAIALPHFPAASERVATASGDLADLIKRRGLSPRIPIAERTFFPPKSAPVAAFVPAPPAPVKTSMAVPSPSPALSPLAAYLRTNLAAMLRQPAFAAMFPRDVTGIGVGNPDNGAVFLLNSGDQIVGRIQPHRESGRVVDGRYLYVPSDRGGAAEPPFSLDLSRPYFAQAIASNRQDQPLLLEPARAAARPSCASGRQNSPTGQC